MQGIAAMTSQAERRKVLRKRPQELVYVELAADNGGMLRDLSGEGFALRAMMPLHTGTKTPFHFILDEATRIEGQGEVLWVEDEGRVAGVRFTELSGSARSLIDDWLLRVEEIPSAQANGGKPPAPRVSTLAELREEIRAVPGGPPPPEREAPANPSAANTQNVEGLRAIFSPPLVPPMGRPETERYAPPPLQQKDNPVVPAPFAKTSVPRSLELLPAAEWTKAEPRDTIAERFTLARAIWIMCILVLLASAYVYHRELGLGLIQVGRILAGTDEPVPPPPAVDQVPSNLPSRPAQTAPPAHTPRAAAGSSPDSAQDASRSAGPPATGEAMPQSPKFSGDQPKVLPVTPLTGSAQPSGIPEVNQEAGQVEYQQALRILRAEGREADLPEAARLLWVSVEKGNPGAEIELADLYRLGRGVTKNCDQTRILLAAAARKGNAEAQKRLRDFEQQGCE